MVELLLNVAIVLESLDQAYRESDIPQRLPIVAALQNVDDFIRQDRWLVARAIDNWREGKAAIVIFLQRDTFQLQHEGLPEPFWGHQRVGRQIHIGEKLFDFRCSEQYRALRTA